MAGIFGVSIRFIDNLPGNALNKNSSRLVLITQAQAVYLLYLSCSRSRLSMRCAVSDPSAIPLALSTLTSLFSPTSLILI